MRQKRTQGRRGDRIARGGRPVHCRGMIIALLTLALFQPPQAAPTTMNESQLRAWVERTVQTDGWTLLAADQMAVALGQAPGVTRDGDRVTATIRHEYYAPIEIGGFQTRSNLQVRQFDCAALRHRTVEMTLYRDNNLGEALEGRRFPDAEWSPTSPASVSRTVLERACAAARGTTRW